MRSAFIALSEVRRHFWIEGIGRSFDFDVLRDWRVAHSTQPFPLRLPVASRLVDPTSKRPVADFSLSGSIDVSPSVSLCYRGRERPIKGNATHLE